MRAADAFHECPLKDLEPSELITTVQLPWVCTTKGREGKKSCQLYLTAAAENEKSTWDSGPCCTAPASAPAAVSLSVRKRRRSDPTSTTCQRLARTEAAKLHRACHTANNLPARHEASHAPPCSMLLRSSPNIVSLQRTPTQACARQCRSQPSARQCRSQNRACSHTVTSCNWRQHFWEEE